MTGVSLTVPATLIREATTADTAALVALGLAFVRESSYAAHVAENPAQIEKVIAFLLATPTATLLVAERDETVIGMIGLMVTPHLFSGVLTAGELAYYVLPAHRGRVAVRLLHAAEAWAGEQGAQSMSMIAPTESVGQFYTRMGYLAIESNYLKRI